MINQLESVFVTFVLNLDGFSFFDIPFHMCNDQRVDGLFVSKISPKDDEIWVKQVSVLIKFSKKNLVKFPSKSFRR